MSIITSTDADGFTRMTREPASPAEQDKALERHLFRDVFTDWEARRFFGLCNGDRDEQAAYDKDYGSPSEADFALCCLIALGTQDGEQIERVARATARFRPKWDTHRSYLATTIDRAAAVAHGQYLKRHAPEFDDDAALPTFQLLDDVEIDTAPDPTWLVEGLVPTDSYVVLYGESSGGKTFLALDWSLCIATGTPWRKREVKQGPVIYIGAEGRSGFKRRVHAWKTAREYVGRAGVQFINATANVRDPKTAAQLLTDIRAKLGDDQQPVMIWLDTLNRHLAGGDENSSKDIGAANATAIALREATGATVGYVHHCRKGDEAERGHSSLRNAADTMMHLGKADDGETRELTCTKQREAEEFDKQTFRMRVEGDSLVIDDPVVRAAGTLAPNDRQALQALADLYTGAPVPAGQWDVVAKLPERTFYRVRARLVKNELVERSGSRGGYCLTATGTATLTAATTATLLATAATAKPLKGVAGSVADGSEETDLPF